MFRPIAAIFTLLQFCSKEYHNMPILRGDVEISSSLRVTFSFLILRCAIPVVCRMTNGEINISHGNTTVVVWIYDGV